MGDLPFEMVVALVFAAFVLLVVLVRGWLRRARHLSRARRAVRGEHEAVELLRARGYSILEAQAAAEFPVRIDGETYAFGVRADYIVAKNGARFVAEVKTGDLAPSLSTAATRRQLLEYEVAFGVDGVLLVDAESRRVHAIGFPALERSSRRRHAAGGGGSSG